MDKFFVIAVEVSRFIVVVDGLLCWWFGVELATMSVVDVGWLAKLCQP